MPEVAQLAKAGIRIHVHVFWAWMCKTPPGSPGPAGPSSWGGMDGTESCVMSEILFQKIGKF